MNLLPGYRLVVAPHFHLPGDWPGRLHLGAGVEQTAEGLFARLPWRPARDDELAMLILDPTCSTARDELANCLCLFAVPGHLRSAFRELLEQALLRGEIPADGFDAFVAELGRFLAFKRLPAPPEAIVDLIISKPEQAPALAAAATWGLINLGEEAASVVFVNVPASSFPGPDYPPVRLRLEPGEGLRFPASGVLAGSGPQGSEQPGMFLVVRLDEDGKRMS